MSPTIPEAGLQDDAWQRFAIHGIEDLANAVLGAGIEAVQMPGPRLRGSLAFAASDGIVWSGGRIEGSVILRGVLAPDVLTVAVLLRAGHGSRLWMRPATDGSVGVIPAGGALDAYLTDGTSYVAATLPVERLAREAWRAGLGRVPGSLLTDGLLPRAVESEVLAPVREIVEAIHGGGGPEGCDIGWILRHAATLPIGRSAEPVTGHARLVQAADRHIRRDLGAPISTAALAEAAETSRRSLYRAFATVFGETPQGYVRRLRLHRVRARLLAPDSPAVTVTSAAERLGFEHDMGRLASRYRELFGETPSATLARRRMRSDAGRPL
jgi:AraC-like DNA-binding protein